MKNKKLLSVVKIIWVIAVIAGGVFYIIKNYDTAIDSLSRISPFSLIVSFLLIIGIRLLNVDLVQRSLIIIGWKPNFLRAFALVSMSQLGKYIPGGIWQFVARYGAYKDNKISNKDAGKSFLIENLWMVGGAFSFSLAFLLISIPEGIFQSIHIQLSAITRILLAILCLIIWLILLFFIERVFHPVLHKNNLMSVLKQFVTQGLLWIINGLSFHTLIPVGNSLNDALFSIGAFGISFLAGYIAIFAPGGIGVREYVTTVLYPIAYGNIEIGILTIVHRLLYTVAEFLLAGLAYLLTRTKPVHTSVESE